MKNDKQQQIVDAQAAGMTNEELGLKLTRRELLEAGLIGFVARMAIPSTVAGLVSLVNKAEAAEAAPMMPFITLSLSGGAALHGNYVVKSQGGSLLSAYTKIGLGKTGFATQKVMGADFASSAKFHQGIMSVASATTLGKAKLVALCTNTANDTSAVAANRPFYDLSGPLEKAGLIGKMLPGVHYGSALENLRPVFGAPNSTLMVKDLSSVFSSLNYSGELDAKLKPAQKQALGSFISRMTKTQVANLNKNQENLKVVLEEAGLKSKDIIASGGGASSVDPRMNAAARSIYGIATNTAVTSDNAIKASVVYNSLVGNVSHARITLGGYDYHTPGLRTTADLKDFNAGIEIGRMLQLAAELNKPVFILVTTDGACGSAASDFADSQWTSDFTSSVQFVISYDPSGGLTAKGQQIGYYNDDQSVDTTTLVGSRPDYVAAAILANYLNVNGKIALFKQLAPATLQTTDLPTVVMLNKA